MHLKQLISGLPNALRHPLMKIISNLEVVLWTINNKPAPGPHKIKVKIISDYAKKFQLRTLIETGTYLGQTVDDLKNDLDMIYSVELDKILYQKAKKMFSKSKNVKIIQGDSSIILNKLVRDLKVPSLFWLDAHYSGGITAKGSKQTPILREFVAISESKIRGHVILVDDARAFIGSSGYPTIKKISGFINKKFQNYKIEIKNDIIRIYPYETGVLEK